MRRRAALILALLSATAAAQNPAADYVSAQKRFMAHVPQYDFLHDDSPAALADIQMMWNAIAAFAYDLRQSNPKISAAEINHRLCLLTVEPMPPEATPQSPEEQCTQGRERDTSVIALAPHVLLIAPFTGEIGTVMAVDTEAKRPGIVWSIASATTPQSLDPHDVVAAWQYNRAGSKCRDKGSPHKPGSCGPLYASLIELTPDSAGHPRFAIDAGYAQIMGATIGAQTTVWRWEDSHAELLSADWYDVMLDQTGDRFDANTNVLTITEKGSFRSFYDCGSCASRPLEHRLLIGRSSVTDLGTRSTVPELDRIDELVWRLRHHQSTTAIASAQAASLPGPKISGGMIESTTVVSTPTGANVCLSADDFGPYRFTLRRTADGGYFIERATRLSEGSSCPP